MRCIEFQLHTHRIHVLYIGISVYLHIYHILQIKTTKWAKYTIYIYGIDQVDRISLLTKLATAAATRLHLHVNNPHCSFISSSERKNLLWKSYTSEVKHVEPKKGQASTNVCKVSMYNFAVNSNWNLSAKVVPISWKLTYNSRFWDL